MAEESDMSKGSTPRPYNKSKFNDNFDRIFDSVDINEIRAEMHICSDCHDTYIGDECKVCKEEDEE